MSANPARRPSRLRLTPERRCALILLATGLLLVAALGSAPDYARSIVRGPMTPGHEAIACTRCHVPAPGTARQQIQANLRHWLGLRQASASFGHEPVTSKSCLDCHGRDHDRHPTFRFREPRFAGVLATLDARSCLSCHAEHRGRRVSNDAGFCRLCHGDLKPRSDPITPSHVELVMGARWDTCLTCHDFHGNHPVKTPVRFEEAHDVAAVRAYLAAGPDPYSTGRIRRAKQP
jgi:hypothetical protein